MSNTFASSILEERSVDDFHNGRYGVSTYALGSCRSTTGAAVMVGVGTTAPKAHCAPRPKTSHGNIAFPPSECMNE